MRTVKTLTDWADAQVDLSLQWAHNHIVGFVMSRPIYKKFQKVAVNPHRIIIHIPVYRFILSPRYLVPRDKIPCSILSPGTFTSG